MRNELIDTLWNVNQALSEVWNKIKSELIDTLWNVNVDKEILKAAGVTN